MVDSKRYFAHSKLAEVSPAVLLDESEDTRKLRFSDGETRMFRKAYWHLLDEIEVTTLQATILDRVPPPRGRGSVGSSVKSSWAPKYTSFEAECDGFLGKFPLGFQDPLFDREERRYKQRAIDSARVLLAADAYAGMSLNERFDAASRILSSTNIPHPNEGPIPFRDMQLQYRSEFCDGLHEMIHGSGPFEARFDLFVRSIHLTSADGRPRPGSWPTLTVFAALYDPQHHVAVKPTCFGQQARLLGRDSVEQAPSGRSYLAHLQMAEMCGEKLSKVGLAPVDLMDVYTFIWLAF